MLSRIAGDLYLEDVPLQDIASKYGTPTYVYSEREIREAYCRFERALGCLPHTICYAVKANSNIAVLQILAKLGAGFDIVSGGELTRVLTAGGAPKKIVFSGVGKQDWEIRQALEVGIGCFNVESASELKRIAEIADTCKFVAPISIRVNPDVDPKTHPYISTGLKENKFGVSAMEAKGLYRAAANDPNLQIVGIDCHIGSQITNLLPFKDALDRLLELVRELESDGISLKHIDLGGGIGVRYRDEEPIDLDEFASIVRDAMVDLKHHLLFEPGRMIVANAGILLTRITTLKKNDEKRFAVVDAAMNDLIRPSLYNAWQDVIPVTVTNKPAAKWDVVGPICETGDFLAKERHLALDENGLIAILSAGAYGFVMSSNYNSRNRAPEILISGSDHHVIRRRETIEDQLALESLLNR